MKNYLINGDECIKHGKDRYGNQRYKRKKDGKIITENAKVRCEIDEKIMAIILYFNGLTLSKIGNIFGVSYNTIANWLDKLTTEIKNNYQLSDIQDIKDIEIDELYHYLDSKKKEFTYLQRLIERHIK